MIVYMVVVAEEKNEDNNRQGGKGEEGEDGEEGWMMKDRGLIVNQCCRCVLALVPSFHSCWAFSSACLSSKLVGCGE